MELQVDNNVANLQTFPLKCGANAQARYMCIHACYYKNIEKALVKRRKCNIKHKTLSPFD